MATLPNLEQLTERRTNLAAALLDAFPTRDALSRIVSYGLQTTLQGIVIGDNLTQDVDGLIAWAEKQGRLKDLVATAVAQRPGNPKLQALTQNGVSLEDWAALDALYTTTPLCPYPGLVPFEAKDAAFFYGREREIAEMLARLHNEHFQLVVGPSGSGKSSLLTAGVLPKLPTSGYWPASYWHVVSMRPGEHPNEELEKQLGGAPTLATVDTRLNASEAQRLLLVVDQFEEVFAQAQRLDQNAFIAAIKKLCALERAVVMLVLRADFYPDLMISGLWALAEGRRLEVVPLSRDSLRAAIVKPAASEGIAVELEPALVERLLNDAADEPGSLPMLQQTLRLLWPKMERRKLTLAAYDEMGQDGRSGLSVAIARIADATFAALEKEQQIIARRVFLHLVQFGEGRPDTRRQRSKAELRSQEDDPALFDGTLTALVNSRLIVVGVAKEQGAEGTVDIAHDTLIRNWPTLQDWIAQSKVAVQTRDWLEEKAAEWKKFDYKSGLLDPGELVEAERWLAGPDSKDVGYSKLLSGLVSESRRQERLNARRRIAVIIGLTLLALSTSIAAGFAFNLNAIATTRLGDTLNAQATSTVRLGETLDANSTAVAERNQAERQTRLAHVAQLNTQSRSVLDQFPQQSLLLAIEALTTTIRAGEPIEPSAEETLRLALTKVGGLGIARYEGYTGNAIDLAISPDSRWLAIAGSGQQVHLRDLTNLAAPPIELTSTRVVDDLIFSPDGGWLLASGTGPAELWDLTVPGTPSTYSLDYSDIGQPMFYHVDVAVFSANSRWLALRGSLRQTLLLWDLSKRNAPQRQVLTQPEWDSPETYPHGHPVVFSTDSRWLLVHEDTTTLWDLDNLDSSPVSEFEEESGPFDALGLSPDRRWLATTAGDNNILVWDLAQLNSAYKPRRITRPDDIARQLAISSNGQWLVNIGAGAATVVDLSSSDPNSSVRSLLQWSPQTDSIAEATMSIDGNWLITRGGLGSRDILNLTTIYGQTYTYERNPNGGSPLVLSSDGHWLARPAGTVMELWNLSELSGVEQLQANLPVVLRGHEGPVSSAAFSSNGRWLATASIEGSVRLWKLNKDQPLLISGEDPAPPNRLDTTLLSTVAQPRVLPAAGDYPVRISEVSSNGRWLAVADNYAQVSIWDLTAPDVATSRREVALQDRISQLAISGDQRWLFTMDSEAACLYHLDAAGQVLQHYLLFPNSSGTADAAFSEDDHWLVTVNHGEAARLWDLSASDPTSSVRVLQDLQQAFSATVDEHWFVARVAEQTVRLWDLPAPDPAVAPRTLNDIPLGAVLAVSPDGRWLASGEADMNSKARRDGLVVHLSDLRVPDPSKRAYTLTATNSVSDLMFSRDGHWLISGSTLWPLTGIETEARTYELNGVWTPGGFSFDNRWLATTQGTELRLWDMSRSDPSVDSVVVTLEGFSSMNVAFSADSRWIITAPGLADDTKGVHLWSLPLSDLVDMACRVAGRNLTHEEWKQFGGLEPYRATCPGLRVTP